MKQYAAPSADPAGRFEATDASRRSALFAAAATALDAFEPAFERALCEFLGPLDGSPVAEQLRWHFGIGTGDATARGKRLRPRLLFAIALQEGGTLERAIDAALAIELLHNYSLVHDDIEDGDHLRRGRQTVWARFGFAHGINAGDAVGSFSYLTLLRNRGASPAERVIAAMCVLQTANLAMCVGQGYDLAFESAAHVSISEYLAMIDGKTATLFGAACELGAICAGGDDRRAQAYGEYGRAYGRAFQIRDDLIGTVADIARRKWSFPIVWALAGTGSPARSAIATRYQRLAPLEGPDVDTILTALEDLGAKDAARRACEREIRGARRIAQRFALDPEGIVCALFG